MMIKPTAIQIAREAIKQRPAASDALQTLRMQALTLLEKNDWPTRRHEQWKYTDPDKIILRSLAGTTMRGPGKLPRGVQVYKLSHYLEHHPQTIKRLMPDLLRVGEANPFVLLNMALAREALVVEVGADQRINTVLNINAPQVWLIAKKGARLTLSQKNSSSSSLEIPLTVIDLAQQARVIHNYQQVGGSSRQISTQVVTQKKDSHFISNVTLNGGALVRNEIQVLLKEPRARVTLYGLFKVGRNQHVDCQTNLEHLAAECRSRQIYKSIIGANGVGVFNGRILVKRGARNTEAQQLSKSLIISKQGRMYQKPQLQIYDDQVNCQHGATIGHLDRLALYYLRSRGFDARQARRLLITSFEAELLQLMAQNQIIKTKELCPV